jgi:hypothetical protein
VRLLAGAELRAAHRRAVSRQRGQDALADLGQRAQPDQVPLGALHLVVAQLEEFLDLGELPGLGLGELAAPLGDAHGLVVDLLPQHRLVVAGVHALVPVELLQLVGLARGELAAAHHRLRLLAEFRLLLAAAEQILDSHVILFSPIRRRTRPARWRSRAIARGR